MFGERLQLDILSMLYSTCELISKGYKEGISHDDFKLQMIMKFGIDTQVTDAQYHTPKPEVLCNLLYNETYQAYHTKTQELAKRTLPIFRDLFNHRGNSVENVVVPFTDGRKGLNVVAPLKKLLDERSLELSRAIEKSVTLTIIDSLWKEHLRDMDDLKQSVQNAVLEQKDPLLIYKFEGFQLFKSLIAKVNDETLTFLYRAEIPVQKEEEVMEAKQIRQPKQNYKENKAEAQSMLQSGEQDVATEEAPKPEPIRSSKVANRNDKVSVQYLDGSIKRDVKFKTVEEDVLSNRCVIIE